MSSTQQHLVLLLPLLLFIFPYIALAESDKLLFVYQAIRHGGIMDPVMGSQKHAELTNMGMRSMYLVGQELREQYINKKNFLSKEYRASEIFMRANDQNRTIESAMAEIIGLYPNYTQAYALFENQTQEASPEFNVSNATIQAEHFSPENQSHPLPVIGFPPRIHVYEAKYDTYKPVKTCPLVGEEIKRRTNLTDIQKYLDSKYSDTLTRLAYDLSLDPSSFHSIAAIPYIEYISQHHFYQEKFPFTIEEQTIYDSLQIMYEYYNLTTAQNTTLEKAFLTSMFNDMVQMFQSTVDAVNDNYLDKLPNRIKLYVYVTGVETILNLANAFKHYFYKHHVAYASNVIFELHEIGDKNYYVNVSINGEQLQLPGACQLSHKCEFKNFVELVKSKSFYGDEESFLQTCGALPEEVFAQERQVWLDTNPRIINEYVNFKYGRILGWYIILMIPAGIGLFYFERKKQQKRQAMGGHIEMKQR